MQTGIIGLINMGLLGHCLLTSWAIGVWRYDNNSEEGIDIHMIGAMYTRLEFIQAYAKMFQGAFCFCLFWVGF